MGLLELLELLFPWLSDVLGTMVTFLVGLVVGSAGIYVGAGLATGREDVTAAVTAALLSSLGWAAASVVFGWMPLLGDVVVALLGLVLFLGVVKTLYDTDWGSAVVIGVLAWGASMVANVVVPLPNAVGVPGI